MVKVDGIGKLCPIPVIETKVAFRQAKENETIIVLVDNQTAVENLTKMTNQLEQMKNFSVEKISDDLFEFTIIKGIGNYENIPVSKNNNSHIITISSNTMGNGDLTLGKKLLEGFIYSLTELDKLPEYIIFLILEYI